MRKSYLMLTKRFFRFLVVGGVNTAFGYACFALLLYLGMHYTLALLVSTLMGVLFNFKTTGRFVFNSHDNRRILQFVSVYAVVYGINLVGLGFLVRLGVSPYGGNAILLLPCAIITYLLQKRLVFYYG